MLGVCAAAVLLILGVGAWAARRASRSCAEVSSTFSSPFVTLRGHRLTSAVGLKEACELLKGDLLFLGRHRKRMDGFEL